METLVSDCFPPIFSYLPLADLLHLQTVSRRLKQEVEDYLPTVRSLPLYLTTPRTPEEIARYENMCISHKETNSENSISYTELLRYKHRVCFRRLRFGTSGPGAFEDFTILQNQNHFWFSDFLVLNHSSALLKFLPFIQKFCPHIEKLALVIDHCDHYQPEVSKVLETFPTIKVLLLERTMQDFYRHVDSTITHIDSCGWITKNSLNVPPEVFKSILNLKHLEELYFFRKRQCQWFGEINFEAGSQQISFEHSIFGQLRVLHVNMWFVNSYIGDYLFNLMADCQPNGLLEELVCSGYIKRIIDNPSIFPKLKKLTLLKENWSLVSRDGYYFTLPRPTLKVFDISFDFHKICPISTQNLNCFTGLESFHCGYISVENSDLEIVPENLKNRTIKHLQLIKGPKTTEKRKREARRWSKYFVKLETCTFLEPEYFVIRVRDLSK